MRVVENWSSKSRSKRSHLTSFSSFKAFSKLAKKSPWRKPIPMGWSPHFSMVLKPFGLRKTRKNCVRSLISMGGYIGWMTVKWLVKDMISSRLASLSPLPIRFKSSLGPLSLAGRSSATRGTIGILILWCTIITSVSDCVCVWVCFDFSVRLSYIESQSNFIIVYSQ